jgi:hypothetical protein
VRDAEDGTLSDNAIAQGRFTLGAHVEVPASARRSTT